MLAGLTTPKKLYISFGAMLGLLLALAFISALTFDRMAEADERNERSHLVISTVQELLTSLIDTETGARGYMLTGHREFLGPFYRGRARFAGHYAEAVKLNSDNPHYRQQLAQLKQLHSSWLNSFVRFIEKRPQLDISNTQTFMPGVARRSRYMSQMRSIIEDIEKHETRLSQKRTNEKMTLRYWTQIALLSGGGVAILLALSLSTLLARSTRRVIQANKQLEQEIMQRELAQRKLEQSERYFRSLTENALDIILVLNLDATIRYVSPSVTRVLGYAPEAMHGTSIFGYVHDDDLQRLKDVFGQVVVGSRDRRYAEYLFCHLDGSWRTLECISRQIADGSVQGIVANVRDVTERKQVELIKKEFVSIVSHELRTPLTSILGSLSLMAGGITGEIPPKALAMVEIARKNSERLMRLVNDILDIEKIESGNMSFYMEPLELIPLVERAIEDNQAYAREFGVHFELRSTPGPAQAGKPLKVDGDGDRLLQLLTNLLSNAVKFSPRGETVTIAVAYPENESGCVRVSLADRGPGVPAEFRSRIFEKFAQADASDTRQKGGTGLGLSICKSIVEKHGGHIGYTSSAGKGATFYFDLPVHEVITDVVPATDAAVNVALSAVEDVTTLTKTPISNHEFASGIHSSPGHDQSTPGPQ